jgi:endonuclease/exonuclease/phosphatase family metal-dependent hydrolase
MFLRLHALLPIVALIPLAACGGDDGAIDPVATGGGDAGTTSTWTTTTSAHGGGGAGGASTGGAGGAQTGGASHGGAGGASTGGAGGAGGANTGGSGGASTGGAGGAGGANTGGSGGTSTGGAGGANTGGANTGGAGGAGGHPTTNVRVVAANLTSGNAQSYDPGHGIRILQGIHGDVVLMQEMNYGANTPSAMNDLVTKVCGPTCSYSRGAGAIPNGVVSRYPIVDRGAWTDPKVANRDFTWARIDVPGAIDLWAVSVHLLTSSPANRDAEAKAIVGLVQANVPAGDFLVIGGDFNTDTAGEPCMASFSPVVGVAGPYPVDNVGNGNTNGPRSRPHDWVLVSPALHAVEVPVAIGAAHFTAGLVVDTRVYTPIADLAPALVGDSGAPSMQHMAVVRDFALP